MLVLDETSEGYVYAETNYTAYRNGIKNILNSYANYTNITVEDIISRI